MDARAAGTIIAAIRDRTRAPTLIARKLLKLGALSPLLEQRLFKRKSKLLSYEKEFR